VIAAALAMAATAGIDLLLTQRLQLVLGLTPLHAGLIVTAFAAGSLPVGVLAGGLLHRTGVRPLIGGGLLLGALGVLVTLLLTRVRSPCWAAAGARHGSCRAWSWPARMHTGHKCERARLHVRLRDAPQPPCNLPRKVPATRGSEHGVYEEGRVSERTRKCQGTA
jgi:hypothetical protein